MDLSSFIVQKNTSVFDATAAINTSGHQVVFVCDDYKLLAVLTDSDIRRFILRGGDLSKPVLDAANHNPIKLTIDTQSQAKNLLKGNSALRAIPVIDENDMLVSIVFSDNYSTRKKTQLNVPVVIMAGGKGSRLAPFTDVLPKPLIPVGDMTITERIMERFLSFGCNDFTMIVNYKKELIKAYFNETPCKGQLYFADEEEYLGTGGGLKLLDGVVSSTFFMTNCDILIEADYEDILKHHRNSKALITMICALKKISVPYGTVELDKNGNLQNLVEKPEFPILTNTGFYVIEPELLDNIKQNESVDITHLIQRMKDSGKSIGVYPIAETDWMDMGMPEEHAKMQQRINGAAL